MFAGIGGFRLGLEKANLEVCPSPQQGLGSLRRGCDALPQESPSTTFSVIWANENNKYAAEIYRKNFGSKELQECDIQQVTADSLPPIDLLCGGFPCQSFSLAGKRKGFSDTRGTLFFEIARIARAKRPRFLLLENVKGLLSAQNGYCFWRIKETLEELGYIVEWKVLNSKYYGVPQNRERVFIIGHLREECSRQVFPIGKNDSKHNKKQLQGNETASTLRATYYKNPQRGSYINATKDGKARTLQGGGHSGGLHSKMSAILLHNVYGGFGEQQPRIFDEVSPTIRTPKGGGHLPLVASTVDCDGYLRTGARPRDENGKPQLLPIGYRRIRRLTPVECERLQGFPDGWTEGVSDTQRYKCLGNAVTVNVIEFLGKLILSQKHRGDVEK